MRDKGFGVPHIYGDTRAELMFGIGYATAEDRLFFIDVLTPRRPGRSGVVRGRGQRGHGREVWADEPYTQQDLVNQVNWGRAQQPYGAPDLHRRDQNYVDGINAYIARRRRQPAA